MFHGHYCKVTLLYFVLSFFLCERISVCGTGVGESRAGEYAPSQYSRSPRSTNSQTTPNTVENEESLRKEIIKVQILQRLGLSEKPQVDIAHKISKDLVLETLRRTENLDQNTPPASHSNSTSSSSGDDEAISNYAKTSEIIAFPDKGPVLNGHTLLSFSYAGNNAYGVGVRVKKAHLWVKMEFSSSIARHFGHLLHPKGVNLYIFLVHGNYSNKGNSHNQTVHLNSKEVNLELVVSRTVMLDSLGWQKLDISPAVQKWYNKQSRHRVRHANNPHSKNHRDKLTLLVDCAGCGHSIHPITFSQPNTVISDKGSDDETQSDRFRTPDEFPFSSSSKRHSDSGHSSSSNDDSTLMSEFHSNLTEIPFLVLETESSPNFKRSRRRALECSPRVKHCCKQRFYISFRDLGWDDWIIAPKGYYANYCRGHCGIGHRTPDTFLNYHTHVLEEYRRTPEGQANLDGITPCCAPTKFAPMSLIYFGPDLNIIKRDLPKMIVEECGCP